MYLPDTNIFIRAIQGFEPEAAFLKKNINRGNLVISVVVIGEFFAKSNPVEEDAFNNLLAKFKILDVDENIAREAGLYRREMVKKTKKVLLLDCFLVAQAKLNHLILATGDKADFPMKDIKIISP